MRVGLPLAGGYRPPISIDWEGRRQILAVQIAGRESTTSWRDLLLSLKQRGLSGVRICPNEARAAYA